MPIFDSFRFSCKGGILQTTTGMAALLGGTTTITTLVGDVFSIITSNELLVVFAACGLLGVGISVFRRLKRAAR